MKLSNLPTELILKVVKNLGSEDYFNFRLSSREIDQKSYPHLLSTYFTIRRYILHPYSLKNLLDISMQPAFAPHVRTLEISPNHLKIDPHNIIADLEHGRIVSGPISLHPTGYLRHLQDQSKAREFGLDICWLVQALRNLPNCKCVMIYDHARVEPFGAATIKRQTGAPLNGTFDHGESIKFVERAIWVVLMAISMSESNVDMLGVTYGVFSTPAIPYILRKSIDNANQLRLNFPSINTLNLLLDPDDGNSMENWTKDLIDFIKLFPRIMTFNLEFWPQDEHRFKTISDTLHLQYLQDLELSFFGCHESDIIRLLLRHKDTLKTIRLKGIDLISDGEAWGSLICAIRDNLSLDTLMITDCSLNDRTITVTGVGPLDTIVVSGTWQELSDFKDRLKVPCPDRAVSPGEQPIP
ncbi:hypothetical protein FQN57_004798 [Myotisia sp. PD_48]|nr:hypothetical protein FQN57_004798 [Myotisia sp. PD_48]